MADPPLPPGYPFDRLKDQETFMAWYAEVGGDVVRQALDDATMAAMKEHGVRVVLAIGERVDAINACLEEFV